MNRPNLEAMQRSIDENNVLTRDEGTALLAYIAELENLVNSMGDEWEEEHALDDAAEFDPPIALQNSLCVAIRRSRT
jgi:hypothetical protein